MLLPFALLALPISYTYAQSSTSSSAVAPSGTAVAGQYGGLYRPQIHFSPPEGFMNDPNGMFLDNEGVYHLYYQYNPTDTIAGNQHWGHATSEDLYHWINQPIALFPYGNVTGIFSGSAVIDTNNTSGFFPNQTNGVVAVYTANGPDDQNQALAFSYDNGYTFTIYDQNPVLAIGSTQFRDPKVIWHVPTQKWVMVVAYAIDYTVGIFTSPNLKDWTAASNFSLHGIVGLQYECPNLLQIPVEGSDEPAWLMYISINPGAPLGGSIGQYFPGRFNGTHFETFDNVARIADFGKDNYASQFFEGIPASENQISIAWASNWQYTNQVPTGPREGWQSAMSLPRVNYLTNSTRSPYTLVSKPYNIDSLKTSRVQANLNLGNNNFTVKFDQAAGGGGGTGVFLIEANVTNLNRTGLSNVAALNFTISSSQSGESLKAGQIFGGDPTWFMDRGDTKGFENVFFTDKFSSGLVIRDSWDMQMVVDRSVWEVFLLNGTGSATATFFPEARLDTIEIGANNMPSAAVISLAVYELDSAWSGQANGNGVVTGNSSAPVRRGGIMGTREFWA